MSIIWFGLTPKTMKPASTEGENCRKFVPKVTEPDPPSESGPAHSLSRKSEDDQGVLQAENVVVAKNVFEKFQRFSGKRGCLPWRDGD
jgi:hypothetical protein